MKGNPLISNPYFKALGLKYPSASNIGALSCGTKVDKTNLKPVARSEKVALADMMEVPLEVTRPAVKADQGEVPCSFLVRSIKEVESSQEIVELTSEMRQRLSM